MKSRPFSFPKSEKLVSHKLIDRLFAGGGILADSEEQQEWEETEEKMKTMKNLIDSCSTTTKK